MFLDRILLCPATPNSVSRLLEQQKDGTILYSRWNKSSRTEEIRLFNAATQLDKLIFANRTGLEIVNASLNPSKEVIAFTTLLSKKSTDVVLPDIESLSSDEDDVEDFCSSTNSDDGKSASTDVTSWHVFVEDSANRDDYDPELGTNEPYTRIKGRYVTHLADVYPTTWMKKFDVSRSMYQKVVFTDCDNTSVNGKAKCKENRLLLIMHRKCVGLYSILLQLNQTNIPDNVEQEKWSMLSPPKSVILARKPLWTQWDAVSQRLYFVTLSKYRRTCEESRKVYATNFSCEQLMISGVWSRKMFSFKLDLNLKTEIITKISSVYMLRDMDPTVASIGINMKILDLRIGGICLAWQTLFYANDDDESLYKIFLIDKNILLTNCLKNDLKLLEDPTKPHYFSFSMLGNNIIVNGNSSVPFLHCLAMDCVGYECAHIHYPCHYMSPKFHFTRLAMLIQLPFYPLDEKSMYNEEPLNIHMYDSTSKSVYKLSMDIQVAKQIYFDFNTCTANHLALARFGRLSFSNFFTFKNDFRDILASFASRGMILHGEKFLGTLLIHYVASSLCAEFPGVPFLARLLPFAIPMTKQEDECFSTSYKYWFIEEDVIFQVSEAAEEHGMDKNLSHGFLTALRCSRYEPYDLSVISDDFDILISNCEETQAAKDLLGHRLEMLYDKNISKYFDSRRKSVFLEGQSPENDHLRRCIMALNYENLSKHLEKFVLDNDLRKQIATQYAVTQQSAVDHYMNLFIFLDNANDRRQSLFQSLNSEEWKLLRRLKTLVDACVTINFPFPTGIQTFLACLSFRSCLTTHSFQENNNRSGGIVDTDLTNSSAHTVNSTDDVDIDALSFEFLQLIDTKSVQLTSEFVAKLLEDIPDHSVFGSLIQEILSRTTFSCETLLDGMLQQWKHPYAKLYSARNAMKRLDIYSDSEVVSCTSKTRKRSIMPQRDPTNFKPLDTFLEHVCREGEKFDVSVASVESATMQQTILRYGTDKLKNISH